MPVMMLPPAPKRGGSRLGEALARFGSAKGGNIAALFALTSVPLLALTGAAIDYGLAMRVSTKLQAATDATALALCQTANSTTNTQLNADAQLTMPGYVTNTSLVVDPLVIVPAGSGTPRTITLTTHVNSGTYFSNFTKLVSPMTNAASQCSTPIPKTLEIALVLDNTGSMAESSNGQTKIVALQSAAKSFVEYVYGNTSFSDQTKIAIVPFAAAVAVKDPRISGDYTSSNANWIDWTGQSSYHWKNINKNQAKSGNLANRQAIFDQLGKLHPGSASYPYYGWNWGGCIETPPYPQNVQDTMPITNNPDSLYQQYFAPDEPGPGSSDQNGYFGTQYVDNTNNNASNSIWNDYLPDSCQGQSSMAYLAAESRGCKYAAATASNIAPRNSTTIGSADLGQNGPNWGCASAPMQRLLAVRTGNNKATLENLIALMSARGGTNIHEGFMWGWRALSPNSVFKDGAQYSTPSTPSAQAVTKIIILMTDGMDDWLNLLNNSSSTGNGALYNALGYPTNSNSGDSAGTSANARLQTNPNHQTPQIEQGYNNIWDPSSTSGRSAIDGLFDEACTNAKASPANVSVYTIAFSISSDPIDATGQTLLQKCASTQSQYFLANDSSGLIAAFAKIASSIGSLRISQ